MLQVKRQVMIKKLAFTLSEVLITLVIIGIVAAMTIPSIIQSTNDSQYKVALKKNYSNFSKAFNLAYGYYFYDDYMDWDYAHDNDFTQDVFENLSRYLNVRKRDKSKKFAKALGFTEETL